MDEFEFDELMGSVGNGGADESFRGRLLTRSQKSLAYGRFKRRVVKSAGLFSCILLIAVGAFLFGRSSVEDRNGNIQLAVGDENVVVSAELVAWLDAGRFFGQIGMEERANKAFKYASRMIPAETGKEHAFGTDETVQLAALLQRAEAAAIENEKIHEGKYMLAVISLNE